MCCLDRTHQFPTAAASALDPIAAGVERIQKLGKALEMLYICPLAVLVDAHKGEIPGRAVYIDKDRNKLPRLNRFPKSKEILLQTLFLSTAAKDQFPTDQRRKAGEALEQRLIPFPVPVDREKLFMECGLITIKERYFILLWRKTVDQPRQNASPLAAVLHTAQAVDDSAVRADQNNIGASADHFDGKGFFALIAHLVPGCQAEKQQAFLFRLDHLPDTCSDQVFTQQHAEHRCLGRVFQFFLRKVDTRPGGRCADKQFLIPVPCPQAQQQDIFFRLLNTVDFCSLSLFLQFEREGVYRYGIQRHVMPSPFTCPAIGSAGKAR